MANCSSTFWGLISRRTKEFDAVNNLNERTSAWLHKFVSKTVFEEEWRENFRKSQRSLYKLADELRVNSDKCGRANSIWIRYVWTWNFWIRKEKIADSKLSGDEWTGPKTLVTLGHLLFFRSFLHKTWNLGIFTLQSCREISKKKARCTSRFVVLLIKPIAFLTFSFRRRRRILRFLIIVR